jgi:hypothetical protein
MQWHGGEEGSYKLIGGTLYDLVVLVAGGKRQPRK